MKEQNTDSLISELRESLLSHGTFSNETVATVCLNRNFLVVRLGSGFIGLTLNYHFYSSDRKELNQLQSAWAEWLKSDQTGWELAWDRALSLPEVLRNEIHLALLSALSQRHLASCDYRQLSFLKRSRSQFSIHKSASWERIGYIGMGDNIERVLRQGKYRKAHIADFNINNLSLTEHVSDLKRMFPEIEISTSDGSRNLAVIQQSDLVCVTASSLANGTLTPLLDEALKSKSAVCLFGISGNLFPEVFFQRGVVCVNTLEAAPSAWPMVSQWIYLDEQQHVEGFYDNIAFSEFSFTPKARPHRPL